MLLDDLPDLRLPNAHRTLGVLGGEGIELLSKSGSRIPSPT